MSGGWDAGEWLERFQELGGGWMVLPDGIRFSWPANGNELLIREHWHAIPDDEERREEVRALVCQKPICTFSNSC